MAKTIIVDNDLCVACKACEIQCALTHSSVDSLAEAMEDEVSLQSRVYVEKVGETNAPVQCRHCADAPCAAICPTEAVKRSGADEPVLVDQERCTSCGLCLLVCPFGVIDLSRAGKGVIKCDLCIERTAAGEQPACVSACPTGALKYEDIGQWPDPSERETEAEPIQGAAGDSQVVPCPACGREVGSRTKLESVRKKLAGRIHVSGTCSRCRRIRSAEGRDKESAVPAGAGRKNER